MMEEQMKKFIPLFVMIGLVRVAAAIYITVYNVGMATRDIGLSGGASELLAWSRARSYNLPIIHSQLV
jgi:hypothetical protein